jgi:hypothetical protein
MKTQKGLVTLITGITLALILSTSVFAGPQDLLKRNT